jgi:hypothetical protein
MRIWCCTLYQFHNTQKLWSQLYFCARSNVKVRTNSLLIMPFIFLLLQIILLSLFTL